MLWAGSLASTIWNVASPVTLPIICLSRGRRYAARAVPRATSNARRITSGSMSTCTSQNQMEADLISRQIFRAMRRQGQQTFMQSFDGVNYETDVISVDAEGGPFQLVDTDRRTPFVFRSYVMFYGEDF